MSFFSDLAKAYVLSAARQAGRNYSNSQNNLYSVPPHTNESQRQLQYESNTSILKEEKEYVYVKLIWAILLSLVIPFAGSLIVFYRGYVNYTKDYKLMYRLEEKAMYKRDGRYRNGQKYIGHQRIKVDVKVDIDSKKKASNKIKAWGYFTIGCISFIFWILVFRS